MHKPYSWIHTVALLKPAEEASKVSLFLTRAKGFGLDAANAKRQTIQNWLLGLTQHLDKWIIQAHI